jgi:glutathione synthase/RimK-type ligase-like ATP-grasp enzyme
MADIGVYVERYNIRSSEELGALTKFAAACSDRGHNCEFLFRPDLFYIPNFDAIFIRALTDPLNASYVAARIAEIAGKRVVDDSHSILVCCDKIHMYRRLMAAGIRIPKTIFLNKRDISRDSAETAFRKLGPKLILKAPSSSFSAYVEKVESIPQFLAVAKRFTRRADRFVVQEFVPSTFDWRVTVLGEQVLFVCKYLMPGDAWKLHATVDGRLQWARVEGVPVDSVDPELLDLGLRAGRAVGKGLYGVDIKDHGRHYTVIEVNDNPTINTNEEDEFAPELYGKIIEYLVPAK